MTALTTALDNSLVIPTTANRVVHSFLTAWRCGNVVEAARQFSEEFKFTDHALGLEFKDKERLTEFLGKTRELYPNTQRSDNTIFSHADGVVNEWTLSGTLSEPFLWGRMRKVPILVRGISVVKIQNGRIAQWSDYYDQLQARRNGLAARFTEWTEL